MLVRIIQSMLVGMGTATLAFFVCVAALEFRIHHASRHVGIGAVAGGASVSASILLLAFAAGASWNLFITRRR